MDHYDDSIISHGVNKFEENNTTDESIKIKSEPQDNRDYSVSGKDDEVICISDEDEALTVSSAPLNKFEENNTTDDSIKIKSEPQDNRDYSVSGKDDEVICISDEDGALTVPSAPFVKDREESPTTTHVYTCEYCPNFKTGDQRYLKSHKTRMHKKLDECIIGRQKPVGSKDNSLESVKQQRSSKNNKGSGSCKFQNSHNFKASKKKKKIGCSKMFYSIRKCRCCSFYCKGLFKMKNHIECKHLNRELPHNSQHDEADDDNKVENGDEMTKENDGAFKMKTTVEKGSDKCSQRYMCSYCDFQCTNFVDFPPHIFKHKDVLEKINCPFEGCNYEINTKRYDVWKHWNSKHDVYGTLKCHLCQKSFFLKRGLIDHVKKKHSDIPPSTTIGGSKEKIISGHKNSARISLDEMSKKEKKLSKTYSDRLKQPEYHLDSSQFRQLFRSSSEIRISSPSQKLFLNGHNTKRMPSIKKHVEKRYKKTNDIQPRPQKTIKKKVEMKKWVDSLKSKSNQEIDCQLCRYIAPTNVALKKHVTRYH